ncbi:hypothetical protein Plec18170_000855 [Paecilomyces lecythidis]
MTAPNRKLDDFETPIYQWFEQIILNTEQESWGIDANRSQLRFEYASKEPSPRVAYLLTVTPDLCNRMGNLHGGCAATLIDNLSSTVLASLSRPGRFSLGGVSRNLKVTYLRPIPEGTEIRVLNEVIHVAQRLALLKSEIWRTDTNVLCAVGEHDKVNTDPEPSKI